MADRNLEACNSWFKSRQLQVQFSLFLCMVINISLWTFQWLPQNILVLALEHRGWYLALLGEAVSQVLCPVLGHSLQKRHWGDECPEKGNKAGEESGAQILWGVAEGAEVVNPEEKEAEGRPYHPFTTAWKEGVVKRGLAASAVF